MNHIELVPVQCCYPLVDHILQGTALMSPHTQCVEVMALDNKEILSVSDSNSEPVLYNNVSLHTSLDFVTVYFNRCMY